MSENNFCSCCLAKHSEKNMYCKYTNGNRNEIYGEMILNTFGINISSSEKQEDCFICEQCIFKLRNAYLFKELVLATQKAFKKEIENMENNLKMEFVEDFDDKVSENLNDSHFNWDDKDDVQNDDIFVIKLAPKEQIVDNTFEDLSPNDFVSNSPDIYIQVDKNVPKKAEKTKSAVNIVDIASWKRKEGVIRKKVKAVTVDKVNLKVKKKVTGKLNVKAKPKKTCPQNENQSLTELAIAARENTAKLILNSNLCLFRSLKTKFGCILCKATFVEPVELKKHFLTHEYNSRTKLILNRVRQMRGLSCRNAEISDLKCKICGENISDLNQLLTHLKDQHDVKFSGTNNLLIPYKLLEGNQCILCEAKFNSYLRLSIHMNSHFPHNVCEICGSSYINRTNLRTHMVSMHQEKKCPHCPAKFLTESSRVKHLRKDHKICNRKSYCNMCDQVFTYSHQMRVHKIEKHGAKKLEVNCNLCGKMFRSDANLRTHIRSVHFRERRFPCQLCDTRFFTKTDLKRHEKTHDDARAFSCSYCHRKFKSKDSCGRHVRKLHRDVLK